MKKVTAIRKVTDLRTGYEYEVKVNRSLPKIANNLTHLYSHGWVYQGRGKGFLYIAEWDRRRYS